MLSLFAVAACLFALPVQAEPNNLPNIVLIVADDIGYSDFGAFGGEIETPHIDALAMRGVRFANFHAASSCAPTRAMLLTGVDNHLAGVGSMPELMPLSHRGKPGYGGVLNQRVVTVATLLQSAGYRTMVAGKWHLGVDADNLPPARGFDHSLIQADSGSDNFEMRPYLPMKPEAYWYENGQRLSSLPADFYSSRYFVDKTIQYLQSGEAQGRPFFAYVAFQANHTPLQAPAHFIDPYRGRYAEGWAQVRSKRIARLQQLGFIDDSAALAPGPTQEAWDALSADQKHFEARRMQAYAGMATAMDHEIGRLVAYLRASGHYDNTVFVLLSDNGAVANEPYSNSFARRWFEKHYHREVEALGERGSWVSAGSRWGRVANTPLSGVKFSAGEGGVRVPLVISGPVNASPGRIFKQFVHVTDLAPTLLQIAGARAPALTGEGEPMTGKSLLPLLVTGKGQVHGPGEPIGYEFSGNAALYRGDLKLVRNHPPGGDGQWRLFNIANDPGETRDLSQQLQDQFHLLQNDYADYVERVGVLPMPDDYSVAKQVAINAALFVYLPRYLPYALGFIVLVVLAVFYLRARGEKR